MDLERQHRVGVDRIKVSYTKDLVTSFLFFIPILFKAKRQKSLEIVLVQCYPDKHHKSNFHPDSGCTVQDLPRIMLHSSRVQNGCKSGWLKHHEMLKPDK